MFFYADFLPALSPLSICLMSPLRQRPRYITPARKPRLMAPAASDIRAHMLLYADDCEQRAEPAAARFRLCYVAFTRAYAFVAPCFMIAAVCCLLLRCAL